MKTTIKNHIQELKNTSSRTGLIYSDNKVMFYYFKDLLLKLEQIEDLIELENELHLTEVGEAIRDIYEQDLNLTHININLQVRKVELEKKEAFINGKLFI